MKKFVKGSSVKYLAALDKEIKPWYHKTYKSDDMWEDLYDGVTFKDVLYALKTGEDVYDTFGAEDSIIRERIFSELSEIMDVDYDEIYYMWLGK